MASTFMREGTWCGRVPRRLLDAIRRAWSRVAGRLRGRAAATEPPRQAARYRARSGLELRSAGEVAIANWLDDRGYVWEYESRVAGFTPDFMLRGERVLIEYWGMKGHNRRYDSKIDVKKRRYREAGWHVIGVERRHVSRLDDRLGRKLKRPRLPQATGGSGGAGSDARDDTRRRERGTR